MFPLESLTIPFFNIKGMEGKDTAYQGIYIKQQFNSFILPLWVNYYTVFKWNPYR